MKIAFFDRDGIVNRIISRRDGRKTSPWKLEEFLLYSDVKIGFDIVKKYDYIPYIVTNQPGIEDGDMSEHELDKINRYISKELDISMYNILCATNRNHVWYKPNNGMIEYVYNRLSFDRDKSFIIGDRWKDIHAGHKSNIKTIYLNNHEDYSSPKKIEPDFKINNLNMLDTVIRKIDDRI